MWCDVCGGDLATYVLLPRYGLAADKIAKAIVDQPLESIFFAFEQFFACVNLRENGQI